MADDATVLLVGARHIARGVNERDNWKTHVVRSADESCHFVGGVNIDASGLDQRLVADHCHRLSVDAGEVCLGVPVGAAAPVHHGPERQNSQDLFHKFGLFEIGYFCFSFSLFFCLLAVVMSVGCRFRPPRLRWCGDYRIFPSSGGLCDNRSSSLNNEQTVLYEQLIQ